MADYPEDYFKPIEDSDTFISDMYGFIDEKYGKIEDDEVICDIMNEILSHNQSLTNERVDYFQSINPTCLNYEPSEDSTTTDYTYEQKEEIPQIKDLSSTINQIKYCSEEELDNSLEHISRDDYNLLKIQIYKQLMITKKEIITLLQKNPLSNINNKQKEIKRYNYILESLSYFQKEIEEQAEEKKYNIIFVPNKNKQSCLFDDIYSLIESSDEISIIIEKLISHQFLHSKGIRQLVSYDKLYEYKTKSGFRILYVTMGDNNLAICSLFYKDKQKSSKIANIYEEAISRYKNSKEYIEENMSNPDFIIEQNEYIAQIRTLLENRNQYILQKKDRSGE